MKGDFESLWMIGEVATGEIDPTSIRVQPDGDPFTAPSDGVYLKR